MTDRHLPNGSKAGRWKELPVCWVKGILKAGRVGYHWAQVEQGVTGQRQRMGSLSPCRGECPWAKVAEGAV